MGLTTDRHAIPHETAGNRRAMHQRGADPHAPTDVSRPFLQDDRWMVSSSETNEVTFSASAKPRATISPSQKSVEPMQKTFLMRGYEMNCEPRVTETGKYAAQVEVTKVGFSREAAFRKLGEFDTEAEAVAYARQFSEEWLSRYA
ncbi:hypothetical protein LH704_25070 [Burkholderia cenocepacia]|nr:MULTISPECIES: hypothetical protein [Burkholderia]MCA7962745.1 hypothetical protein [Burkholderia cenocepacia]MCF1368481.1 hypothetical protein [Burkholderia cenocepacia]MCF1387486.1 hypothetical protein [Burkholderia cenocepacia]